MSPIEHVWDALDRHIQQRVPGPANIQQLHTAIEEEWTNIPQATIRGPTKANRVPYLHALWTVTETLPKLHTDTTNMQ